MLFGGVEFPDRIVESAGGMSEKMKPFTSQEFGGFRRHTTVEPLQENFREFKSSDDMLIVQLSLDRTIICKTRKGKP